MYIVSSSYRVFQIYGALILTEGMRHYSGKNNNQSHFYCTGLINVIIFTYSIDSQYINI